MDSKFQNKVIINISSNFNSDTKYEIVKYVADEVFGWETSDKNNTE